MNNTTNAFKDEISRKKGISKRILATIDEGIKTEFVLNTVELEFDFDKKTVEIFYFIVDDKYPNTTFTFSEFKKLIKRI